MEVMEINETHRKHMEIIESHRNRWKSAENGSRGMPNMPTRQQLLSRLQFTAVARKHLNRMEINAIIENNRKHMKITGNHRKYMEINVKFTLNLRSLNTSVGGTPTTLNLDYRGAEVRTFLYFFCQ